MNVQLFSEQLLIEYSGWVMIRLPTDPDPSDERRGVSGYTFAFGNEPDLDRIIHLQLPHGFQPRSYAPPIGVLVRSAMRYDGHGKAHPVCSLVGAAVELLEGPMLENRNWILTLPGYEPIVPFVLRISHKDVCIQRDDLLDPSRPDMHVWEATAAQLQRRSAWGMELEPETIGRATGIWDSLGLVKQRLQLLEHDLVEEEQKVPADQARLAILWGRIQQLKYAVDNPKDRRVFARYFVERFGFQMNGSNVTVTGEVGGALDTKAPWSINFFMGAWDPDVLCAYMQGSLAIPYLEQTSSC